MSAIARIFSESFSHWQIVLPPEALISRQRGEILQAGWRIQYLFGQNERGAYLDYYAMNRMTNDTHVRIYTDGAVEQLEAPGEFMVFPANCTPEEKQRIQQKYYDENRRIYAELARKGFG